MCYNQSRKLIAFKDLAIEKVGRLENDVLVERGKNYTIFFIRIKFCSLKSGIAQVHRKYTQITPSVISVLDPLDSSNELSQ